MITKTEEYYIEHRTIGDYLDKESVLKMMNGYARQYHTEQLKLCGVSVSLKQGLSGAVEEVSKHLIKPKCVRDGRVKRNEH